MATSDELLAAFRDMAAAIREIKPYLRVSVGKETYTIAQLLYESLESSLRLKDSFDRAFFKDREDEVMVDSVADLLSSIDRKVNDEEGSFREELLEEIRKWNVFVNTFVLQNIEEIIQVSQDKEARLKAERKKEDGKWEL